MGSSHEIPSLVQIIAYIQRNGWKQQNSNIKNLYVYSNEQEIDIILPKSKDLIDYEIRIKSALEIISDVECIPVSVLVMAIMNVFSDIIRVSICDKILKNGTIPLVLATEFISGLKDLMAYSATSEELKTSHFQRTIKKGIEFSDACRFGHTFVGSFGFSVACPLERKKQEFLMDELEVPPFERKVVKRLYRGISIAKEAYIKEDMSCIVNSYDCGLSANMAEQIVVLHEIAKNNDIRYNFTWSPEWKIGRDIQEKSIIDIDYNFAEFLRTAAKSMKHEEKRISTEFIGLVVGLRSKNVPFSEDEISSREVTIRLEGDDAIANEVKIIVDKEDYLTALEAHKSGQRIKFQGIAEKKGKKWHFEDYSDLTVI